MVSLLWCQEHQDALGEESSQPSKRTDVPASGPSLCSEFLAYCCSYRELQPAPMVRISISKPQETRTVRTDFSQYRLQLVLRLDSPPHRLTCPEPSVRVFYTMNKPLGFVARVCYIPCSSVFPWFAYSGVDYLGYINGR